MAEPKTWIEQLSLTSFRNYTHAKLEAEASPVVLVGHNGAGKTNILEAVSLISPGRGLRRAAFADMSRVASSAPAPAPPGWAISARLHAGDDPVIIGTGLAPAASGASRLVRIDGEPQRSAAVLADYVEMTWLTPAFDGVFTGGTSDRRRFLDRLVLCFDAEHGTRANRFERAMRQRNKLLDAGARSPAEFGGLEEQLAETGVAISAARFALVQQLSATILRRREEVGPSAFPWAEIALTGSLEEALVGTPASDVEDDYRERLARARPRDQAARRTLEGPHRADLEVQHGPKAMPAKLCSTGEQKALLVGLVLAHADLLARRASGGAPILLLDEIAAHLDADRRAALFDEILSLGSQAWMTGTDHAQFSALQGRATFFEVTDGAVARIED